MNHRVRSFAGTSPRVARQRLLLLAATGGLLAAGCGSSETQSLASVPRPSVSVEQVEELPPVVAGTSENTQDPLAEQPKALSSLIEPLGSAQVDLSTFATAEERKNAEQQAAAPAWLSIPSLSIDRASVLSVGVEPNGEMQIPPAEQLGWYRFGALPGGTGDTGTAVIAGHIAYNGVDGVFRYLADLEIGTTFSVGFNDGTSTSYVVSGVEEFLKEELPAADLFRTDGAPRLVLITCGGSFNYDESSYDSNIVAFAVPLATPGE